MKIAIDIDDTITNSYNRILSEFEKYYKINKYRPYIIIEKEYKRSLEERARQYFDVEHSLDVDVKRREAEKELAAKEAEKERQERKK